MFELETVLKQRSTESIFCHLFFRHFLMDLEAEARSIKAKKINEFILYCARLALSLWCDFFVTQKIEKIMTTVVIDNTNPQAQDLLDYIRSFSFAKVIENKRKADVEEVFERIPGLAYTREERIASVRKSMEDVRAGRVYSAEQVRAMFPRV